MQVKYEKAQSVQDTIRAKCIEYVERAEYLKKQVNKHGGDGGSGAKALRAGGGKSGGDEDDDDDDADFEQRPPLTEGELVEAEAAMEADLSQLVGMDSVKGQMRKLCKQLALDIVRRSDGQTVLAPM